MSTGRKRASWRDGDTSMSLPVDDFPRAIRKTPATDKLPASLVENLEAHSISVAEVERKPLAMDAEPDMPPMVTTPVAVASPIPVTAVVAVWAAIKVPTMVPAAVVNSVPAVVPMAASVMPVAATVMAVAANMGGRTGVG